jgi:glycosyltransferase involved in cell wall biosynthesis
MRAFVLTADPAAPPVSGAELRNWQNAVALAKIGRVTLVSVRPLQTTPDSDVGVEVAALTGANEQRSPAIARRTTWIDVRISRRALGALLQLVEQKKPDVVVVEGISLFPLLEHLRPHVRTLILDMHNIESDLAASMPQRWSLRNVFSSDAARLRLRERDASRLVDRIWVCSEQDRARLRKLIGEDAMIDVVPNGIPRFERIPQSLPPHSARETHAWPTMLFVGHLGYPPNAEAATSLVTSILPLVTRECPGARLVIAGRFPGAELRAIASGPGIQLVENPGDDLAPLYAQADVAVVPLSRGGGTRIKILEAMAFGVPVVATRKAAEGLGFAEGEDILLADTEAELAAHICALGRDPGRLARQREHAFQVATRRFGRGAVSRAVREAISHAIPDAPS